MGNKIGFFRKLKICWFLFTNNTRKNILTVSYEFCGSTNIVATDKLTLEPVIARKEMREYQAKYICMSCKASCACIQQWSKATDETMAKIKQQIDLKSHN